MVIWITGLSGAGKTTVSRALGEQLKATMSGVVLVDGDVVRLLFGGTLGHSEPERVVQIKRIQTLTKFLDDQDLVVIVAALYASPALLSWNRENFREYFEVYLSAPLPFLRQRDDKGLYGRAARGEMPNVVGVDIPWHAPASPDLVLDASSGETPAAMAQRIRQAIPRFSGAAGSR
jgi:cytidine diphosphoramidate kinase